MLHNRQYQQLNGLGEMVLSLYRKPEGQEAGQWLLLKDISRRMKEVFRGGYQEGPGTLIKIGQYLSRPEYAFERRRIAQGYQYRVVER